MTRKEELERLIELNNQLILEHENGIEERRTKIRQLEDELMMEELKVA